jgi:hypothetical protein
MEIQVPQNGKIAAKREHDKSLFLQKFLNLHLPWRRPSIDPMRLIQHQ